MTSSLKNFQFRPLRSGDFAELKKLHEELFPVRYLDSFYEVAVRGVGLDGRQLFTVAAVTFDKGQEVIAGFILAQFLNYNRNSTETTGLFDTDSEPLEVCYILTLGLRDIYRRIGLGSRLVQFCVQYAMKNVSCGAVSNC